MCGSRNGVHTGKCSQGCRSHLGTRPTEFLRLFPDQTLISSRTVRAKLRTITFFARVAGAEEIALFPGNVKTAAKQPQVLDFTSLRFYGVITLCQGVTHRLNSDPDSYYLPFATL